MVAGNAVECLRCLAAYTEQNRIEQNRSMDRSIEIEIETHTHTIMNHETKFPKMYSSLSFTKSCPASQKVLSGALLIPIPKATVATTTWM